jgi:hypothetical protein
MMLVAKMKMVAAGVVACVLTGGTVAVVVAQSQAPASRDKAVSGVGPTNEAAVRVRECLTTDAAGGELPTNFAVRIVTDAVGRSIGGFEGWRFTPGSVATLGRTNDAVGWTVARVATNFAGIGTVCRALQEADFAGMASRGWVNGRGGNGPFFSGTPSISGERAIAVFVGTNELTLGRSCWRATRADESASEKRMADLYETLKAMAPSPAVAISNAIETGAAGGVAPAGFSVSIETFGVKKGGGKSVAAGDLVSEAWRFTSTNVFTYSANAVVKTRVWAGMRDVCRALATAGFVELATAPRQDGGEETWVLGGEKCREGWQCIHVRCDDQSLTIGEGLTWKVYTDPALTGRMRGLYQKLRKMALPE